MLNSPQKVRLTKPLLVEVELLTFSWWVYFKQTGERASIWRLDIGQLRADGVRKP